MRFVEWFKGTFGFGDSSITGLIKSIRKRIEIIMPILVVAEENSQLGKNYSTAIDTLEVIRQELTGSNNNLASVKNQLIERNQFSRQTNLLISTTSKKLNNLIQQINMIINDLGIKQSTDTSKFKTIREELEGIAKDITMLNNILITEKVINS